MEVEKKKPELRFPEFTNSWNEFSVSDVIERVNDPVDVESDTEYQEIGVRSHGKGIFHKMPIKGFDLGNKRVFWVHPNAFVVNIVFGWEQAVALTSESESGFIASHRFPMYIPIEREVNLEYFLLFFLCKRGKYLLELASPGGAGRNKTLGQNAFLNLSVILPTIKEQQKIAGFLSEVNSKINQLHRKHELLEAYKRGVMQKLFSQALRFKQKSGSGFPDWQEKRAYEIFNNNSNKNHNGDLPILAATQDGGMVYRDGIGKQIKTSEASINSYKIVEAGDFVISLRSFQGGIEYSNLHGICSPAYTILKPSIDIDDDFYRHYFKRKSFVSQLSATVIGIRDGKQISYDAFSGMKLWYPSVAEQNKISEFINAIDKKIAVQNKQIEQIETFKKGLLQKMFV